MKKINHLGVFDSGLGGYSVYMELVKAFPQTQFTVYADQGNAPYGNQTPEAIVEHAKSSMEWFESQGIMNVLIACNTVCAIGLDILRESFPQMTFYGIIDLTLNQLEPNTKILVLSTQATHDTEIYRTTRPELDIQSLALPKLVNYIENMEPTLGYLESMLDKQNGYDVVVLGCTHYPLVADEIAAITQAKVVDSRSPIKNYFQDILEAGTGEQRMLTTGDARHTQIQLKELYGVDREVEKR